MTDPQDGATQKQPYEYPPLPPQDTGDPHAGAYPPPMPPQYGPQPGAGGYPPPGAGGYPAPGGYPPPPGAYPPAPAGYYDPSAPWGRHPVTGEPFSDKSKVIAGLLQFLGLFGLCGIGRIYLGDTGLGVIQLVVGLVTCGIAAVIWGIIDAIMILTDKVRDPQGRPLRDGT